MKKKIMSLLLASAMAVTAVGLTACGGDNDGGNGINGNTDPSTIVSEKVENEAAWRAAFDYNNVNNFTMKQTGIRDDVPEAYRTQVGYVKADGSKTSEQSTRYRVKYDDETGEYIKENGELVYEQSIFEAYTYSENGKYYRVNYYEDDSKWYRYETSDGIDNYGPMIFKGDDDMIENYAEFVYDDKKKAYVGTITDEDDDEYNYVVKIVDGKVVYYSYAYEYEGYTDDDEPVTVHRQYGILIYDVGTTSVTLPANIEDYPEDAN
ncbi:MAG: hypothetical protein K2I75_06320 [Clostridiales bacterium]|nr:hypothetical protein [Clostridiales bacterium]